MNNATYDNFQKKSSYDIAVFSEIGKRSSQQDCAYVAADDNGVIAVLCDGMGGYEGGQLASQTAVNEFLEYYQCFASEQAESVEWMKNSVERIDSVVYNLSNEKGKRLGAGTTLVALRINGKKLTWVSVGDSRMYLKRGSEMVQITTDHNYFLDINKKRDEGTISSEKYAEEAESGEALISFIGMGGLMLMDISDSPFELIKGDVIFICSDGVYRAINDKIIHSLINSSTDTKYVMGEIRKRIEHSNLPNQDNNTGIMIRIN